MEGKVLKAKHPLYTRWKGMMDRCYNKKHKSYKYYGNRDVKVAQRWHKFENFVYDIDNILENGHLLYEEDYRLDKDKKGGKVYSLGNCMVIPANENEDMSREKQKKKVLIISDNEKMEIESLAETNKILNIPRSTIISCIRRNSKHKSGYNFKYSN